MEPMNGLPRAGRLLAEHQDANLDQVVDMGLARRRLLTATPRRGAPLARVAVASVVMVAAAVLLFLHNGPRGVGPLTFRVGEARRVGELDAWLAAPAGSSLPLNFSDGTAVILKPSARARVTRISHAGATLVLETGHAEFAVVKRKDAAWQVSLGPFRVQVTGTRFDLDWEPRGEELVLTMHEGGVIVSGCMFGTGRAFVAGDTVHASCRDQRADISAKAVSPAVGGEQAAPDPTASVLPDTAPAGTGNDPMPGIEAAPRHSAVDVRGVSTPTSGAVAGRSSWRELVRAGRHREALDAAETAGFSAECASASAAELVALGDAARYVGRLERADEAYGAVRRRFAGQERAAVAAFALGRIAFDQRADFAGATRWFRTYLAEQPEGRLARDALGRLMEARSRVGDAPGARAEARKYLDRYPSGPHAEMARRLTAD
jgi:transmembrane sensor